MRPGRLPFCCFRPGSILSSTKKSNNETPIGCHFVASAQVPFLPPQQKATMGPYLLPFCCFRLGSIPSSTTKSNNETPSAAILLLPRRTHSCFYDKKQQWDPIGCHFVASAQDPFLLPRKKATMGPHRLPFCSFHAGPIPASRTKSNNGTPPVAILLLPHRTHSCFRAKNIPASTTESNNETPPAAILQLPPWSHSFFHDKKQQ